MVLVTGVFRAWKTLAGLRVPGHCPASASEPDQSTGRHTGVRSRGGPRDRKAGAQIPATRNLTRGSESARARRLSRCPPAKLSQPRCTAVQPASDSVAAEGAAQCAGPKRPGFDSDSDFGAGSGPGRSESELAV